MKLIQLSTCSIVKLSLYRWHLLNLEDANGWDLKRSQFKNIETKDINFYNNYTDSEHLKTNEDNLLFPERFIVNVTKIPGCNTDLNVEIIVTLHKNDHKGGIY